MTIWDVIYKGTVPRQYIEQYRDSRKLGLSFSDDNIRLIIIARLHDNVRLISGFLSQEIKTFSANNTKENSEFAEDLLYRCANERIGLFNDRFEERLALLCGEESLVEEFMEKLQKEIKKMLNKYHKTIQKINQSITIEQVLNDPDPRKLIPEFASEAYRLNHDPNYLMGVPTSLKKFMADFAQGNVDMLKTRAEYGTKNQVVDKPRLGMKAIALVYFYLGKVAAASNIETENASEIAALFDYKMTYSGKKLKQHFDEFKNSKTNRVELSGRKASDSKRKMHFETCIDYLEENNFEKSLALACSEYQEFIKKYEARY